jgi:TPR repeat protein
MPPTRDQLRLLREGVEAGDAEAQLMLGLCCYKGDGVPQNYREAARLFRLAADQGYVDAQGWLARCYMQGIGVLQDKGEAVRLLALAAEQGRAHAQLLLAGINRDAGGPAVAVPREAARVVAHKAQLAKDPKTRAAALSMLGDSADDRNVARTCCIGCGKTEQLQVCAKCLTAKFCSRECQRRMWSAHKQACRAWAEQKAAAAAEAGVASSSAQAESGEAEEQAGEDEEEDVASLPAKELKRRLDCRKISYAGVLERSELVALLEHAAKRK